MPPALQKRLIGLPAWAWIAVVAGGLTIGLILRARRNAEEGEDAAYDEDVASADDPYADMYTTAGYPNEYYSIPAGAGSGYGYEDGYEYMPTIPSWLEEAPDWLTEPPEWYETGTSMPNATDPNVEVTVNLPPAGSGSTTSCVKPKPNRPAGRNRKWECRNGKWVAVPKGGSGQGDGGGSGGQGGQGAGQGGGGGGDGKCGPKPSRSAGHNRHWVCKKGKWVAVQDNRAGGNSREAAPVTGGGPPDRRSGHAPPPPARTLVGTSTGGSGHTSKPPGRAGGGGGRRHRR